MIRDTGFSLAAHGRLSDLPTAVLRALLDRTPRARADLAQRVTAIIEAVREDGDAALLRLARELDQVDLDTIEIPRDQCEAALAGLDPALRAALAQAHTAIARFHALQRLVPLDVEVAAGVRLGRRPDPLARVGVYAPGGRAAYASSVLMGAVPARVAGVPTVVVCSPPAPDGRPSPAVLAACALAEADHVYALGGAGAVAAMALGTASVPRVDKIVGPGNAYVTEAKRQLGDHVATDGPAGPSEVLVVADVSANPDLIAAELAAQAEHDPDAAAVLVSTDEALLGRVARALDSAIASAPRGSIIAESLAARGALLFVETLDAAIDFASEYAPEHLALMVERPREAFERVRNAGSVFLGDHSSVAFGDYITGANHVLPTAGLARAHSGLSTADFVRWTTVQEVDERAAARLAGPTVILAEAEGLPAHAATARLRATTSSSGRSGGGRRSPAGRSAYRDIELYDPGRRPCEVDLSDNTGLFGPAPSVLGALERASADDLTRYPSVYATPLKEALAALHGVSPDNVVTGCGSDDVIDSALRAFCEPGALVVHPAPTFGMVPSFARMNVAEPLAVPLLTAGTSVSSTAESGGGSGPASKAVAAGRAADSDEPGVARTGSPGEPYPLRLDVAALTAAAGRATYICRPNNPTGTPFEREDVERVIERAAGVVLIDEAYADFADDDLVAHAVVSGNAVVLRTLSKAFALAGMRIGYALGPAPLIREIEKSRGPYKVSGLAEAAALAALTDTDWVLQCVATVRENRTRFERELTERGLPALPSAANFLLVPVRSARALADGLREHGVAVRAFPALPVVGDAIRISIGPWPMMQRALEALDACAAEWTGADE